MSTADASKRPPEIVGATCSTFRWVGLTARTSAHRHPLYRKLIDTPDSEGRAGDVDWNFEKFLVSATGEVGARFRPAFEPESAEVQAIEAVLAEPSARLADGWETASAATIRIGDRVRPRDGIELTVTRIETPFFGREEMLALIEATMDRWLKVPVSADAPVQIRRRIS